MNARLGTLATGTAVMALGMSLFAGPASAEETTCRGSLGAVTVDNLRVPQNGSCSLTGTKVKGTIKVEGNATLNASRVNVIGNVQAENARSVTIRNNSSIGGSVQVVQGGGANVTASKINGDILYDDNNSRVVAKNNQVGGQLQAFQNTGGVTIQRNTIKGNLQCKANRPAPTGGGNVVDGNKEDQCARL
ncbi:hypothetical protein BH20ACT5_BH20ACT5_22010 [soil metagenome]